FGVRWIAPILASLHARHPRLVVDLGLIDRVVDPVEEGWDVAVRIGAIRDTPLVARRLAACRTIVAASDAYLAARGRPSRIAELSDHDCLGYTLSASLGPERWHFEADGSVAVSVSGPVRASNGDALREAAIAGLGLVYQPVFLLADAIRAGQLRPLALDRPTLELPGIFALYPAGRRAPPKVRAFVEALATALTPEPWAAGDIAAGR
ncbi:MAG: substrate binding domain-containing protein, partial [Methylobacteriaceae bacterium]|nr:substrate binding domain-containing protein [Methylobacteriaceae bacterium]